MTNRSSNDRIEVVINLSDVMNLIPEYDGTQGEIEFMYFREACRNALAVLGPKNEGLLLTFLKTKLKDDAYMRYALRLPTYEKLSQFLCDVKYSYAQKCDDPTFWQTRMFQMRQKSEQTPKYAAKFQELLSCGTIAARHEEMLQAFMAIQENKEKQKKVVPEKKLQIQESPKTKNTNNSNNTNVAKRRLNLEEVMEIIAASAPYDDENPKIETPVTPQPKVRAEKTLSIKGADYPQLEYPKMPSTKPPYKNNEKDYKVSYKKDEEDLKWELKPKTIVGKNN